MTQYHFIKDDDLPEEGEKVLGFVLHPTLSIRYAEVVFMYGGVWYGNDPWEKIYEIDGVYAWQKINFP